MSFFLYSKAKALPIFVPVSKESDGVNGLESRIFPGPIFREGADAK